MKNIFLFVILILFVNCAVKEPKVINYKQDITPFIKDIKPLHVKLEKFNSHYYSPWNSKYIHINKKSASWANRVFYKDKKFFSENTLPWSLKDILPIINSTNFDDFNTTNLYAITSKNAQIRNLPTYKPFFRDFKKAGEGYPFDYMQNSRIHIGTPLLISHYSGDGSWAFVQNPFSFGWIPVNSITIIDENQIQEYKNLPKIVITRDNVPIYTKHQKFFTHANLGAIFPVISEDEQFFHSYILINTFSDTGKKIFLMIPKTSARKFPLVFNSNNIKTTINELISKRYGWGGYLQNRDCSAMTKDYFSVFGIWLPRNSAAQKDIGRHISLKNRSDEEKEKILLKFGIPFRTLIYLKGHIMLYIGTKDKKATVLHNLWGLKIKKDGEIGRYIIGKAIISDLYLGKNLIDIQKKSLLIKRIRSITILPNI